MMVGPGSDHLYLGKVLFSNIFRSLQYILCGLEVYTV